jgi:ubiquinone/menaquinone biosynthesis C-methylase UbiE
LSVLTPRRVLQEELLDEHDAPREDMERSLRDLRRINRFLGGHGIYRRLLRRLGDIRSVVDVGAGTADLVSSVPGPVTRVALDFKIDHLLYMRDRRAHRVVGDASRLPFRTSSVDAVTSAHFFHHFSEQENIAILNEALRVARRGVAVNDTRRHYVPLAVVKLLSVLRLVGRITRFDAPASVLRGYTHSEVATLVAQIDATAKRVPLLWPFRFGILLWK